MPTGYTARIYEGKPETLREFIEHASRAMGAYVMQRDESSSEPPKAREESPYYRESVARDTAHLVEVQTMTDEDKQKGFEAAVKQATEDNERRKREKAEVERRYRKRISDINSLNFPVDEPGPVGEFFTGFRKFLLEQLQSSLDFDGGPAYITPVPESVEQWYADELARASRSLSYSSRALAEEIERVDKQNQVHNSLMNFLDTLDGLD